MDEDRRPSLRIALVHHADAVGPDVDPARPLSARGRAQADWLAARAKSEGIEPAVILHSGKLRARQTAEFLWRRCNLFADFKMARGLRPDDPPDWMRDALAVEDRSTLLVSHMPLLPALARTLKPAIDAFPLHGLILLERLPDGKYVERLRLQPPADL